MSELHDILNENKVKGFLQGSIHTHVSMGSFTGKFAISRKELERFWKAYSTAISSEKTLCLAEKAQKYIPVLGDIDIKVKESDLKNKDFIHTEKHVKDIIEIYQSVLRTIVENCNDNHLICVLLEKPMYKDTSSSGAVYYKHGFHIHFPYCFLDKIQQEIHLIPRVQTMVQDLKVFDDLGIDSTKIIDKAVCGVPWLMYGSSKKEGMKPYLVSKVFNSDCQEISLEEAFKEYSLYDVQEKEIKIRNKIQEYLPRILSIIPSARDTQEVKMNLVSPIKDKIKERKKGEFVKTSISQDLEMAKMLLPLIADSRAEDRNEWLTVGWVLFNIGDGCNEALDLWCDFSSRCGEKYDENVCIHQWDSMIKKDLSIGTLKYYASIDSPEKYNEIKKEQVEKYVKSSLQGSHNDIAKILFAEYGSEFVCASIGSKEWYQFANNKWEYIEEGITLREKISGEILDIYTRMRKNVYSNGDKEEEDDKEKQTKQLTKMISNLKSSPFKSNVMKECQEVFYNKDFIKKLNSNPNIFPFKNGVYDLNANIFRKCTPEDYVSKTAPIEYKQFSEQDDEVLEVLDFLQKVFPDKSLRTYFLDICSDLFLGGNRRKEVYFLTGEKGDNGKSITQNILEQMLGGFSVKLNTTVITGKKVQNGAANPELSRTGGGVRLATLEEPNNDETISIGILKNLSGNDNFLARDLFQKGKELQEIKPMFKIFIICNKLPRLKHSDKAVWNRIRVIPFESTFCRSEDPAPESFEEQLLQKRFPMDGNFCEKVPRLLEPLAWLLLYHRQNITERIEPAKVKEATIKYRKENDIYRQFMEENIIENPNGLLSLAELYPCFKNWYKDTGFLNTIVKSEVEDYFADTWGEPIGRNKKWKGYSIRDLNTEENVVIVEGEDFLPL